MSKRKPTNVYFYIRFESEDTNNYEISHDVLMKYCKQRKLLRISGSYIDYCDNTNMDNRIELQKMLTNLIDIKNKFIIACNDKATISSNEEEVILFENKIKQLGGLVYFHRETIIETNRKMVEKVINKNISK